MSMGIPADCWKLWSPKTIKALSMKNSSIILINNGKCFPCHVMYNDMSTFMYQTTTINVYFVIKYLIFYNGHKDESFHFSSELARLMMSMGEFYFDIILCSSNCLISFLSSSPNVMGTRRGGWLVSLAFPVSTVWSARWVSPISLHLRSMYHEF